MRPDYLVLSLTHRHQPLLYFPLCQQIGLSNMYTLCVYDRTDTVINTHTQRLDGDLRHSLWLFCPDWVIIDPAVVKQLDAGERESSAFTFPISSAGVCSAVSLSMMGLLFFSIHCSSQLMELVGESECSF